MMLVVIGAQALLAFFANVQRVRRGVVDLREPGTHVTGGVAGERDVRDVDRDGAVGRTRVCAAIADRAAEERFRGDGFA